MLNNRNKKQKYQWFRTTIIVFSLISICNVFLFFYMGYNVKYDLRRQVNSCLSTNTFQNRKSLKRLSANHNTFIFLRDSFGSEVRSLSDSQGNLGDPNDGYFGCSINGKTAGIVMTKKNGGWKVTSIQVYK